jgi:hypothetical protein
MKSARTAFIRRIRRFAATRRRGANATRGYAALAQGATLVTAGLLVLSGWITNPFVTFGLFVAGGLGLLAVLVRLLRGIERRRSDLREALGMETLVGGLNSRLISALDFLERPQPSELTGAVIEQAGDDLRAGFEKLIDRRELRRQRVRGLLALAACAAIGCTPWFGFGRMAATWDDAWFAVREALFPIRYTLTPPPGKPVIAKIGTAVPVSIRFSRPGYKRVTLTDELTGADPSRTTLEVDTALTAGTTLDSRSECEHRLQFDFGRRRSEELAVIFALPPALVNAQTELIYPTYTRLLPKDLEGLQDRLTALAGTKITMGFTFTKSIEQAALTWDSGERVPLFVGGRFASLELIHTRPGRATLDVTDIHGFSLEQPHVMQFEVVEDERPRLFVPGFLKQDMPTLAEGLKTFGFGVRAEDDYGITRFVLRWSKSTVENRDEILEKGEIERLVSPARQRVTMDFSNAFENLEVQPADVIAFQVDAYDNREPTPQKVTSAAFSLFIYVPSLGDIAAPDDPTFGGLGGRRGRIPPATRETAMGQPQSLKTTEQVVNEFEAPITGNARLPPLRGAIGRTTRRYFQALAPATFDEKEE